MKNVVLGDDSVGSLLYVSSPLAVPLYSVGVARVKIDLTKRFLLRDYRLAHRFISRDHTLRHERFPH